MLESKWDIYNMLPRKYYPETLFFFNGTKPAKVVDSIYKNYFNYPLIGKPDIGMQGIAVKKLDNETELIAYAAAAKYDFLVQEFVPYKNEVGIFYYRYPNEQAGHISGIVRKEFLAVTGDGVSTIRKLLTQDKRYVLQLKALNKIYGEILNNVLQAGEEFVLVPYGNHVRGAKFVDASDMIDEKLERSIDAFCRQVDGFYFGRLDIRYNSWEELREGKNFSVIELNGAGSEPTHMYDPKHSVLFAWKEITRHWKILWKISKLNHDKKLLPYMDTQSGLNMLRENNKYVKMISDKTQKRA
jgi:hypothetical protein